MKIKLVLLIIVISSLLCSCTDIYSDKNANDISDAYLISDTYGNKAYLPENPRVVSCYGSFSECWLLAGGELVGVTDDAVKERNLSLRDDVEIIGTVKNINLEKIISLKPDYVILSADIVNHTAVAENLKSIGISYGFFRVDNFNDYSHMMSLFCSFNKRDDLYNENVINVKNRIDSLIKTIPTNNNITYIVMRVYSTGIKVKTDNIADYILKDIGAVSVTNNYPSILEDLSVEEIIKSNPDHIFILTMGDEVSAQEYFYDNIVSSLVFSGLSAVKNGNFHILPKELFHYKPNKRWDESYEYLAQILYPEVFCDE